MSDNRVRVDRARNKSNARWTRSWLSLLVVSVIAFAFLFGVYRFTVDRGIPPEYLMYDPNAVSDMPFYVGGVTLLGLILWSAAAAFSYMGAILLYGKSSKFRFLLSAGVLTTALALDDAFELHATVFTMYLNIPKVICYAFYLFLIVIFIGCFLRDIFDTGFLVLFTALICMAVSIYFDLTTENVFLEDGSKFLGIAFWFTYFLQTALDLVRMYIGPV